MLHARRVFFYFVVLALVPTISAAAPRRPQTAGSSATAQNAPVIRSTTHLVQISVVVTDKKGQPVTGLKKEDFTVLDEAHPQQIAFFSAEAPAAPANGTAATARLPKNVYTNRYDLKGLDPGAVTVILFDSLNTSSQDQQYVREQVIKFLKTVKAQDHVAVYALTTQLLLLHEFTQDSAALVGAASRFNTKELAAHEASNPAFFDIPELSGAPGWQRFQAALNDIDARIADQKKADRAEATAEAFSAIANHVAAIPGRKNLIWVSGSFPLQVVVDFTDPTRVSRPFGDFGAQAARALNRVDMVLYPVDATGVMPNAITGPQNRYTGAMITCMDCVNQAPGPSSGMNYRQDLRDTERTLADATGGQAFYGSNDIRAAMNRVFDDGRYAYTIGFYPNHGEWNGKYRKIKIQTKIDGAKLRYREGYYADAENAVSGEAKAKEAMQVAAMSPLDATALSMIVTGKLAGSLEQRKVEVHIGLDPKQLLLQQAEGHRKGAVDLYFVQRDAKGQTVAAENQRLVINLEEKQYEYLGKAGFVLARHLTLDARSSDVRVFVRDESADVLGSVTVPVQALLEGPQTSGEPTKTVPSE